MDAKSLEILATCHEDLQRLLKTTDEVIRIKVTEGYRDPIRQERLYALQLTDVKLGKHNKKPSEAADICPESVNWSDYRRFYFMAGIVLGVAHSLGIKIRLGADWDGDTEVLDQKLFDLGHIELIPPKAGQAGG